MRTITHYDKDTQNKVGPTAPWAVTWMTWPILFAFNVGLACVRLCRTGITQTS